MSRLSGSLCTLVVQLFGFSSGLRRMSSSSRPFRSSNLSGGSIPGRAFGPSCRESMLFATSWRRPIRRFMSFPFGMVASKSQSRPTLSAGSALQAMVVRPASASNWAQTPWPPAFAPGIVRLAPAASGLHESAGALHFSFRQGRLCRGVGRTAYQVSSRIRSLASGAKSNRGAIRTRVS